MFYRLPKTEESRFQSEILSPSFVPDNLDLQGDGQEAGKKLHRDRHQAKVCGIAGKRITNAENWFLHLEILLYILIFQCTIRYQSMRIAAITGKASRLSFAYYRRRRGVRLGGSQYLSLRELPFDKTWTARYFKCLECHSATFVKRRDNGIYCTQCGKLNRKLNAEPKGMSATLK